MKSLSLYYRPQLTFTNVHGNINSKLNVLSSSATRLEFDMPMCTTLALNICYSLLFLQKYEKEKHYSLVELCDVIDGILRQEAINIFTELANIGMHNNTKENLYKFLKECMSYEVIQRLGIDPVKTYAVFLFAYVLLADLPKAKECSAVIDYALNMPGPTLAWEHLYLYFEEEILKNV